jgi:hypothetical protein
VGEIHESERVSPDVICTIKESLEDGVEYRIVWVQCKKNWWCDHGNGHSIPCGRTYDFARRSMVSTKRARH